MQLSLFCIPIFGFAEEMRLFGFERYGNLNPWMDATHVFTPLHSPGPITGVLNLITFDPVTSIFPYAFENDYPSRRPDIVDDLMYESFLLEDPISGTERMYPLIAEAVRVPKDFSYVIFELNPSVRFIDGAGLTEKEITDSYKLYRNSRSEVRALLDSAVSTIEFDSKAGEVRFNMKVKGQQARNAIAMLARMKIVRENTTTNPIVHGVRTRYTGSGPYGVNQLGLSKVGWVRNIFYWGSTLPTRQGFFNFQRIELRSFSDESSAITSFLRGESGIYVEPKPRTAKDISMRIGGANSTLSRRIENNAVGGKELSAFAINLKSPAMQDVRVRKALVLAFNFEENRRIVHDNDAKRPTNLFAESELEPKGRPSPEVLGHMNTCYWPNDGIPAQSFEDYGNAYASRLTQSQRLSEALRLLNEAGYRSINGRINRTNSDGSFAPVRLTFVASEKFDEIQMLYFRLELDRIGVDVDIITPDEPSRFAQAVNSRNYDLIATKERFLTRDLFPDDVLARPIFHSEETNPYGLDRPCIDDLVGRMATLDPSLPEYSQIAEALVRMQQALYLNVFVGEPASKSVFSDTRLDVPEGLSMERTHLYGFWRDK